jgi:hypothetical protein
MKKVIVAKRTAFVRAIHHPILGSHKSESLLAPPNPNRNKRNGVTKTTQMIDERNAIPPPNPNQNGVTKMTQMTDDRNAIPPPNPNRNGVTKMTQMTDERNAIPVSRKSVSLFVLKGRKTLQFRAFLTCR